LSGAFGEKACHPERLPVILSEAKDLAQGSQLLRYAQHDTSGSLVIPSLVILSGSLVILSEAKDLALGSQMLRLSS